ncbi:hypothetical protein HK102_001375 [Quaeritorhiza haematococci]|nr:hypothetical protein HK102_001375 [Quaeritorhiza haematococci]
MAANGTAVTGVVANVTTTAVTSAVSLAAAAVSASVTSSAFTPVSVPDVDASSWDSTTATTTTVAGGSPSSTAGSQSSETSEDTELLQRSNEMYARALAVKEEALGMIAAGEVGAEGQAQSAQAQRARRAGRTARRVLNGGRPLFLLPPGKMLYAMLGYAVHGAILFDHARRNGYLHHPYARTLRRIMVKWTTYVLMSLKFMFFISIELGLFPTFCGILIDLCTLPVFGPAATIASRLKFHEMYPWTSRFLHWLAGTTFMFQFALYVSTVREMVRPGVMWFIRDPNDPQFHPMNDIIERPVLLQLRKLAVGTIMYAAMVMGGVGGFVAAVYVVGKVMSLLVGLGGGLFGVGAAEAEMVAKWFTLWPLKWEFSNEPISDFPIDLLMFHFVVPWIVRWLRPKRVFRSLLEKWFRWSAHKLRLTHFLFGAVRKDEETDDEEDDEMDSWENVGKVEPADGWVDRWIKEDTAPSPTEDKMFVFNTTEASGSRRVATGKLPAIPIEMNPWEPTKAPWATVAPEEGDVPNAKDGHNESVAAGSASASSSSKPKRRERREFRYMRVPNHDHVEVIPGQKMLIPIRENDPVVGRPNETQEEVRANWKKVYVPDRFKIRVVFLLVWQWVCGLALATALFVGPLLVGRLLIIHANNRIAPSEPSIDLSTLSPDLLSNFTSSINNSSNTSNLISNFTSSSPPVSTVSSSLDSNANATMTAAAHIARPDLPTHDLYSYSIGLLVLIALYQPLFIAYRFYKWVRWIIMKRSIRTRLARMAKAAAQGGKVTSNGVGVDTKTMRGSRSRMTKAAKAKLREREKARVTRSWRDWDDWIDDARERRRLGNGVTIGRSEQEQAEAQQANIGQVQEQENEKQNQQQERPQELQQMYYNSSDSDSDKEAVATGVDYGSKRSGSGKSRLRKRFRHSLNAQDGEETGALDESGVGSSSSAPPLVQPVPATFGTSSSFASTPFTFEADVPSTSYPVASGSASLPAAGSSSAASSSTTLPSASSSSSSSRKLEQPPFEHDPQQPLFPEIPSQQQPKQRQQAQRRRRRWSLQRIKRTCIEAFMVSKVIVVAMSRAGRHWWNVRGRTWLSMMMKLAFLAFWVGLVIPLLFGLVFEFYIMIPLKGPREQTPIFFFLQDWALGAVYVKIIHATVLIGPETEIRRVLSAARQQGLRNLRIGPLAYKVILPTVSWCVAMIAVPLIVGYILEAWFSVSNLATQSLLLRFVFPGVLAIAFLVEAWDSIVRLVERWMQQIRDEQFLVGRRLHNIGDANPPAEAVGGAGAGGPAPEPEQ